MKVLTLEKSDIKQLIENGFIKATIESDGKNKKKDNTVRIDYIGNEDKLNNIETELDIIMENLVDFNERLCFIEKKQGKKK